MYTKFGKNKEIYREKSVSGNHNCLLLLRRSALLALLVEKTSPHQLTIIITSNHEILNLFSP
jgi:hypothetical protein